MILLRAFLTQENSKRRNIYSKTITPLRLALVAPCGVLLVSVRTPLLSLLYCSSYSLYMTLTVHFLKRHTPSLAFLLLYQKTFCLSTPRLSLDSIVTMGTSTPQFYYNTELFAFLFCPLFCYFIN